MTTSEIISLVSAVVGGISATVAAIALILNYRNSKPDIKINIKQEEANCFVVYNPHLPETEHLAVLRMSISNHSSKAGTIAAIYFMHGKHRYDVETIGSLYPLPKTLHRANGAKRFPQDLEKLRLQVPLVVPPFSAIFGEFYFPDFPATNGREFRVDIVVCMIDTKVRKRVFKNVRFDDITHNRRFVNPRK